MPPLLIFEEPEGLPVIRGDAARVTQVLNNLLANAWQYTPQGGRVTVSVMPKDGFLQVDVDDTGIGISPSDVGRIFDRFYRVDHPIVQEAEGTGLGLSIVKMFVEMLGGEIWVESRIEVGSKFSFTLPLFSTELPETVPDLLSPELAAGIGRRPKILVVEDDRDLAVLLRRQLESEGYQVFLASGGEDALWLAREAQPQLITLDIDPGETERHPSAQCEPPAVSAPEQSLRARVIPIIVVLQVLHRDETLHVEVFDIGEHPRGKDPGDDRRELLSQMACQVLDDLRAD